jgi:hypothetical protein
MKLTIILLVTLYSYSSNAGLSDTFHSLTGLSLPKGFDPSNFKAFKGFDGKHLNPFDYDINDVMIRFAVNIRINLIFIYLY